MILETEQLCNLRYHIIVRDELSTVYIHRIAWKLPEMPPEIFNWRVFIPAAQYKSSQQMIDFRDG